MPFTPRIIDPNAVTITTVYNKKTGACQTTLSEALPYPAVVLVIAAVLTNFSNQTMQQIAAAAGQTPPEAILGGNNGQTS